MKFLDIVYKHIRVQDTTIFLIEFSTHLCTWFKILQMFLVRKPKIRNLFPKRH